MKSIQQLFPPVNDLLTLPEEQVAPILLEYLQQFSDNINRCNLTLHSGDFVETDFAD